jgi:exodeoxyribonuclease VII large subunit
MADSVLPRYSVSGLNRAVANLLERGFAPRFLLDATVSRPQLKKGHLWMTLVDEEASISAVVWASQLSRLTVQPEEGDGVVVVGKLNFWATRANLCVQVLDLRPSLSSVLRRFERVREQLAPEGLFDPERKRPLPEAPACVALLTAVPSSALADMLRTAAERWPATRVVVVPIPVQGNVETSIATALGRLGSRARAFGIEAVVLARGGGSREDLAVFDGEVLARAIAACPVPVVSGIGHEDDTTIADLVADYRAATPTAALVALLPDCRQARPALRQLRRHLGLLLGLRLQAERQQLGRLQERLAQLHPSVQLGHRREDLERCRLLLRALSPQHLLERGFSLVRAADGRLVRSAAELHPGDPVRLTLADGHADAEVREVGTPDRRGARQSRRQSVSPSGIA